MDISQVQTVLGLAASAVGVTGQAAANVEAIKKAFSSGAHSDSGEAQQLLNGLAAQLTSANMMNVQLSTMLKDVCAAIERENKFEQRLERYRLVDTGFGEMIYTLRHECANGEPEHHICPICVEKLGKFYFITGAYDAVHKTCQGCRHPFQFNKPIAPRRKYGEF
ncbi:hypothetical protein EYE35_03190 [Cereibacter sphaeroides]|nr:hypothetical protein EYE35_03190 [Cereibacter sphaeroides]